MGKSPEEGIKAPVKTSTTTNITLSGTGQTLNGVVTGTGDRVLVKDQTNPAENGTYKVGPDAWERTTDMNAADDLEVGMLIVDSNTEQLYSISFTGPWTPDITALVFSVLVGAMPDRIILTAAFPIDLVDHTVALVTGALDPSISPHLEFDFQAIQSKSDDNTIANLFLNPFGGDVIVGGVANANLGIIGDICRINMYETNGALDQGSWRTTANSGVLQMRIFDDALANFYEFYRITRSGTGAGVQVEDIRFTAVTSFTVDAPDLVVTGTVDGVDIDAFSTAMGMHVGDGTIHFTQAAISITASQVSDFAAAVAATPPAAHTHVAADITDFATEVAANAAVALNTAKLTNVPTALSIGTVTASAWAITSDGGADDVVIPVFNDTDAGLAPGSSGGTVNFLRADATWATPPDTRFTAVVETTTSRTAVAFEAVMADDDTAAGIVTIDLPAGATDAMVIVKKIGSSFDVIIDGDAAETIDGLLTFTLTAKYASITVLWNGTEWSIV